MPSPSTDTPATAANLYERLADIAGSLTVEKNGHMTEGGKYDYVKHQDLVAHLKPILREKGVVILPVGAELVESSEFKTRSGGLGRHARIRVTYRVVDAYRPEVSFEMQGIGESADTGDKGTQKAITSAEKYLYMRLFKVVEDALDTDGIAAPEGVREDVAARPPLGSAPIPQSTGGVDQNQLDKLKVIAGTMPKPWAEPVLKARLERFGFEAVKADLLAGGATITGEIAPPPPPPPADQAAA